MSAAKVTSAPWRILAVGAASFTGLLMEPTIARAGVEVQLEYDWVGVKPGGAQIAKHISETYWIGNHNIFKYYDSFWRA